MKALVVVLYMLSRLFVTTLWTGSFLCFVAIKVAGHSFADWSWWWLILSPVPMIGLAVQHFGL